MARPWRILALCPTERSRVEGWLAGTQGWEVVMPAERTQAHVRDIVREAEIVIADWSSALRIDSAEIAAAPHLAFVQATGVGVDSLDVTALAAAGIPVANSAGRNARTVAEWCVGAAFAVARDLVWADRMTRAGEWPQLALLSRGNRDVIGRRVGVVGFGAIGAEVARAFTALGSPVSYWTRTPRAAGPTAGPTPVTLDELLATSEIVTVNIALAPETRGLLDRRRLQLLPRGAILIDASRGGVVDHAALVDLVEQGHLRGAAVDVFEREPVPLDSPLLRSDRILVSPHAATVTAEAIASMFGFTGANIGRAMSGLPVENVVNGVDPVVRRRPPLDPDD